MQRSILKQKINTRLYTTAIIIRSLSNKIFSENNFEISPEQYSILSLIIDNEELYQRQLSEITLKDRANISRIIKILERKKLIIKIPDSNGRQIFKLKSTEYGIDLYNKILPVAQNIRQIITEGISNQEMEMCLNTLDKIFFNVKDKVSLQI